MNLNKLIGEYKGNARIYLEGSILSSNGFGVGDRYYVYAGTNNICLAKSEIKGWTANSKKKVSKKVKSGILIPVIDLCDGKKNQNIRTILGGKNAAITIEAADAETIYIKRR